MEIKQRCCSGNPDAKRLYDDLLSNYNKLVRPVVNVSDALQVKIKLKLSQLIDVWLLFEYIGLVINKDGKVDEYYTHRTAR
ncbi:hypothetical protein WA026_009189 [Henosepilachna vigintioctopunctata]|uniref:Neurotransmitter-gated ion-channel ligand-binding domain-containing protein n=1 Tax=Henosepilachna vigintioctopunctata TaxID=420089 RepID=A0AAW1UUZ2_9CUCU